MEATQITVSDKVGTTQVLVDSTARLGCTHHLGTRAALSITPGGAFFVTGARTEPVCAFRHLFCQAPSRRLHLICVLHLFLQVNGGKMRQRKHLELGHLPFLQLFYFLLFL